MFRYFIDMVWVVNMITCFVFALACPPSFLFTENGSFVSTQHFCLDNSWLVASKILNISMHFKRFHNYATEHYLQI